MQNIKLFHRLGEEVGHRIDTATVDALNKSPNGNLFVVILYCYAIVVNLFQGKLWKIK